MFDEQRFYDSIQRDFPIVPRPFQSAGAALDLNEHTVLSLLARDVGAGRVSRIGAVFAPNVIGASTLAALAVPPDALPRVAARVNAHGAVSHNYARHGHRYNLWFVAGARNRAALDVGLGSIADDVDQLPLDLPMEREYHIDLGFSMSGASGTPRGRRTPSAAPVHLDDDDWRLVAALEMGLPLTPQPFHALARRCGMPLHRVLSRIAQWHASGVIRRFGVILHHRHFGYRHNAMCVWNVPDARVDTIGTRLARVAPVSLCYRRTRRLPGWPYNLFAMVHARSEAELQSALEHFDHQAGMGGLPGRVLRSGTCFKQCGTRYSWEVPPT
ncbi:Heme d1 biosynthesis protein NirD [Cupriavidus sp. U2]|uniref:siroheme decarboxylase subunit beta n=1 Tax=Cupriavidus sp. U2 TaxID=2920269 RepID=UPI00129D70FD|nr:Lrp/AsnC family transcriptional regulator [Cupriavidus sp. U2]KAI3593829.1 Heme d1 biosynthesis protein NirD [Cupriavidus sp. U2]